MCPVTYGLCSFGHRLQGFLHARQARTLPSCISAPFLVMEMYMHARAYSMQEHTAKENIVRSSWVRCQFTLEASYGQ